MKRSLYLLRHSYAESPGSTADFDRELTMEGISAARSLGRKLMNDRFNPQTILSSSANRAYQTAINLAEELAINDQLVVSSDKLYEASVRELMEVVNRIESGVKTALLVGHNPSISYFAELLTASGIGNMEPCGLVIIRFEGMNWDEVSQGTGIFASYYHPNH